MKRFLDNLEKYLKFYFLISIVTLSAAFLFLLQRVYKVETYLAGFSQTTAENGTKTLVQKIDTCGEDCQKQIQESVSTVLATVSGTTKTPAPVKTVPTTPPQKQTTYIPLSGPITTTSTDWVDAAGTDVYIDLANDYGKNTYVTWQAFLQVTNGNGQAFARLFDVTHGIAVDGSEISATSGNSTQVTSGQLSLWSGRNLYRVQLKSLNSFIVTFASGRIKINY